MVAFVDWYNHQHRHNGIRFVTPHQRNSTVAVDICRHRAQIDAPGTMPPIPDTGATRRVAGGSQRWVWAIPTTGSAAIA